MIWYWFISNNYVFFLKYYSFPCLYFRWCDLIQFTFPVPPRTLMQHAINACMHITCIIINTYRPNTRIFKRRLILSHLMSLWLKKPFLSYVSPSFLTICTFYLLYVVVVFLYYWPSCIYFCFPFSASAIVEYYICSL